MNSGIQWIIVFTLCPLFSLYMLTRQFLFFYPLNDMFFLVIIQGLVTRGKISSYSLIKAFISLGWLSIITKKLRLQLLTPLKSLLMKEGVKTKTKTKHIHIYPKFHAVKWPFLILLLLFSSLSPRHPLKFNIINLYNLKWYLNYIFGGVLGWLS